MILALCLLAVSVALAFPIYREMRKAEAEDMRAVEEAINTFRPFGH